jgi:protein TonB
MLGPIVLAILTVHPVSTGPVPARPGTNQQPPATVAQETARKPWPPAGVVRQDAAGVKTPRLTKDVKPNYTAAAMREKIEGTVWMEVVVTVDGTVGDVKVTQSLDREFGLDDQAVTAVRQWRFDPGTKDGVAVPVLVTVQMDFKLRR